MSERALSAMHIIERNLVIPPTAYRPRNEAFLESMGVEVEALPEDAAFAHLGIEGAQQSGAWRVDARDASRRETRTMYQVIGTLRLPYSGFSPEQVTAQVVQWINNSEQAGTVAGEMNTQLQHATRLQGLLLVMQPGLAKPTEQKTDNATVPESPRIPAMMNFFTGRLGW